MTALYHLASKRRVREFIKAHGVGDILHMSQDELETSGFTQKEAQRISAAVQVVKEAQVEYSNRVVISNSRNMADYLMPLCRSRQECFWILGLSVKQEPILLKMVAMGTPSSVSLNISSIIGPIISRQIPRMAIVHNHPSGDPSPSTEDIKVTTKIRKAAELMGIELIDHIIVTPSGNYTSFADEGTL